MGNFNKKIFGKKKFSDILEEIYDNSKKKEEQISVLISELRPLVKDIGDATLIVPLIKEYMELGIKNDEALIKMSAIVQRAMNASEGTGSDITITDAEKQALLDTLDSMEKTKK